jgi:hypothetical protein
MPMDKPGLDGDATLTFPEPGDATCPDRDGNRAGSRAGNDLLVTSILPSPSFDSDPYQRGASRLGGQVATPGGETCYRR